MAKYIDKSALVAEIERIISLFQKEKKTEKWSAEASQINVVSLGARIAMLEEILSFIDTLEIKEVDEEYNGKAMLHVLEKGVKQGRREILNNLWKPADGNNLPEVDREVIVLLSNNKVCFAHRPQEYWDGKNIATEEITRYYPKRYDKGGWNIPDVKWWLDLDLPNMEE